MVRRKQAILHKVSQSKKDKGRIIGGAVRRRYRPGVKALMQIREFQRSTKLLIRRLPFARVVREVTQEMFQGNCDFRWQVVAIMALQEAAENFLVTLLADSYLCTLHAKRVTLKVEDIRLCRRIRGVQHMW
ncbi:DgyrCDS4875 [Dimorphilus gyrociliatus]|uniref:DgyrCDS4875 n=1 Tax=Dimorphilus gyrociliatus TaxID=2664684 RepID=A0A7I8VI95_9ANNE|nr:DgyrCDS4875 [Dimorphilus gyrociliatus]